MKTHWMAGFWRTLAATVAYAVIHSAFASRKAKQSAVAVAGARNRNGLYRVFFIAQSFATIVPFMWFVRKQPKRMIYEFFGWKAIPFRAVQASGFAWACWAAWHVGLPDILGIRPAIQWIEGVPSILPEPEAQGPSETDGHLRIAGPFRLARHPLNFAPLVIVWSNPRLSTNLLAFNIAATVYLLIGSSFEEKRLLDAYGRAYARYQRSGVSFYLPRGSSHSGITVARPAG